MVKYDLNDYQSGDGMLTSVWGPPLWHYLHTMSFNYPVKPSFTEKKRYMKFMLQLMYVLPCKYCRTNLKNNYKVMPLTMKHMKNRHTFSLYVYDLHERINSQLGKESNLTYENVRNRYEHFRARCGKKSKNIKMIPKQTKSKKDKKEKGCTDPLYGKGTKCVLTIVPKQKKCLTFQMNMKRRKSQKKSQMKSQSKFKDGKKTRKKRKAK